MTDAKTGTLKFFTCNGNCVCIQSERIGGPDELCTYLYLHKPMRIYWDPNKSRSNLAKHKISFERASFVFADPFHISEADLCESEERWQTLGIVNGAVIVLVVHTVKEGEDGEEEIRIISARKATLVERETYDRSH